MIFSRSRHTVLKRCSLKFCTVLLDPETTALHRDQAELDCRPYRRVYAKLLAQKIHLLVYE